jgi:Na+-translocating ferredoxin:NAD+ oxidoreductase RnfG subunit
MKPPSKFFRVVVCAGGLMLVPSVHAEQLCTTKDALKHLLAPAPKLTKLTVTPTADEAKRLKEKWGVTDPTVTFYLGKDAAGATVTVALLLTEQGKEGPISAAISLGPTGKIAELMLLEFSEEHGKPAKEAAFLGQFKDKDSASKLKVGEDVDGVVGATWTSTSMATLARRSVALYQVLVLDRARVP